MSSNAGLTNAIRHLRRAAGDALGDPELLDRYVRSGDQEAFAILVRRYGPLVLGVARRQLGDLHRADDVFQACFLALARSAAKLGGRPVLANWLYTVALRQARKARGRDNRRQAIERAAPPFGRGGNDPLAEITAREFLRIIDDELARLPERLRFPVLLCCVQGMTRDEAAQRLGWSIGSVKGRLERGRRRLATRLAARGLAPATLLTAPLANAVLPADLLARAVDLAAAPWVKTIPTGLAALASTAAPRAFVLTTILAGGVLAVALGGWMVASGGMNPARLAPAILVAAAVPAANPIPDDPLPEGAMRRFGSTRYRHPTIIEGLAVSADGKVAVAHSGQRTDAAIRAYDLATGRVLHTYDQGSTEADAVALSPDGRTLAVKRNFSVYLLDAATGRETGRIPYASANPYSTIDLLLFTPDGRRVVVASADAKALHLVDVARREVVRTIASPGTVFAAAISPDGKHLVAGGFDYDKGNGWFARRWEIDTGKELDRLPFDRGVRSVAYSPDGETIALGAESAAVPSVMLIDAATGKERLKIPFRDAYLIRSIAFSPDGTTVAAAAGSSVRLFDAATGKERLTIDRSAGRLRFLPDGKTFVGTVAGTIDRWDTATGKSLIPVGGDSAVVQIAMTTDGKRVISRGQEGDAHVWDARTGEHRRRIDMSWEHGLFALSPDGRFLVWPVADEAIKFKDLNDPNSIYTGSRLRMMDLDSGQLVERFGGFEGNAHDIYFTEGGKTLVTAERFRSDARVRIWSFATGKLTREFAAIWKPEARVLRSRLSPDGKMLAVQYQGRSRGLHVESEVKTWDTATGNEIAGPPPSWFDADVMAFSPDGTTFAAAIGGGRTIQFQEVATGQVLGELKGPPDRVTALAFDPDRLCTGSPLATIIMWDRPRAALPPTDRE